VQQAGKSGRAALTIVGGAFAVGLLALLVSRADPAATWTAIRSAGPLAFTALVPFAFGITADAYGLLALVRGLGHPTRLSQILPVRLASEALHLSMPAGFVAADTATAVMLESRCGVPLRDGVVASIARKWLVMRMHAVYIVVGAIVGFAALAQLSRTLVGGTSLPWIVAASSIVPLSLSMGLGAGLLGRSTFARLHAVLSRIPSRRLAAWLESRRHDAAMTDRQAARLRAHPAAIARASIAFLVTWCFEALESALLLNLVGAHIDLAAVFAIEAGLSLVRSAAVAAPSGLGVVDLGYVTVLPPLGADAGAVPAFVLLKRAKEVVWVLAGYAIIAAWRSRSTAAAASVTGSASVRSPADVGSPAGIASAAT
jgi:hypothetical protein